MTWAHLQVKEVEQRLTKACRRVEVKTSKLNLHLGIAICAEEAEAWVEGARDEVPMDEDMVARA